MEMAAFGTHHVIGLLVTFCLVSVHCDLDVIIMHNNDFHARYEQTNKYSSRCSDEDAAANKCYGGTARLITIITEIRRNYTNTMLLSGGDEFQGTFWFYKYGGALPARYMNRAGFDASALGNHEFDSGPDGLIPFLDAVNFPILASNLDISNEPSFSGKVSHWTRVTLDTGDIVGVAGYTLAGMSQISNPGSTLTFEDEIVSLRQAVVEMKAVGINKIIAIGHSGFKKDKEIATAIEDIDVVVGGHTNTFLYTGDPPSNEKPEGEYPFVVTHSSGRKSLVVQAYAFGKYLGFLKVKFDDSGDVKSYAGNPILLDGSIEQDAATLLDMEPYKNGVKLEMEQVIADSYVRLEGGKVVCRLEECNLGNLMADSMLWANINRGGSTHWSDVSIAIVNAGGIRSSIEQGNITYGDVLAVMPFRNTVDVIEMKGRHFKEVLEHSVAEYDPQERKGQFLQFSGVHVTYNVDQPSGQRVHDVKVQCAECDIPAYVPLEEDTVYKIVLPSYLAGGGDYYTMIPPNIINHYIIENLDTDIFIDYVKRMKPITHGVDGRIRFFEGCQTSSSSSIQIHLISAMMCVITAVSSI